VRQSGPFQTRLATMLSTFRQAKQRFQERIIFAFNIMVGAIFPENESTMFWQSVVLAAYGAINARQIPYWSLASPWRWINAVVVFLLLSKRPPE
jgi:hypothetical protein